MELSKRDAETAALRCLGMSDEPVRRVHITSGAIEGPSAGLMFALGIVDRLEHGDITRGRRIAGTGTIAPDGSVGPVGNIPQKVQAADDVAADVFLVPASQADVATDAAIGVDVIGVRDLDDALRLLGGAGCSAEA
jgi:PDZ domain-containing protein